MQELVGKETQLSNEVIVEKKQLDSPKKETDRGKIVWDSKPSQQNEVRRIETHQLNWVQPQV